MPCKLTLLSLLICVPLLGAQQNIPTPHNDAAAASTTETLPQDPAKLAAAIKGSYYRPDGLSAMECDVVMDWAALFTALKQDPPPERIAALKGLKTHVVAARGKAPDFTFDWITGVVGNKEQIEGGLKETVGGFYQMYWPIFATPLFETSADIGTVNALSDGSATVSSSGGGEHVVITVDREAKPTHWVLDGPAMKATIDAHYTPSPDPTPGDLNRISSMGVVQNIGTSTMSVELSVDYQPVSGFYIPKSVVFGITGAYSISMEFSGCSVTKTPPAK
jgi:hypothetical protein